MWISLWIKNKTFKMAFKRFLYYKQYKLLTKIIKSKYKEFGKNNEQRKTASNQKRLSAKK